MNKLRYKLVFSKRLGMLVPIAEIARTHQKTVTHAVSEQPRQQVQSGISLWRLSSGGLAMLLAGCLSWVAAPVLAQDAGTLPTNGNIVAGAGTINVTGNTMDVNTSTNQAIIHWDSFNIGANAGVNFNMPNTAASVLNRVMGDSASLIQGMLNSNGHVYIVNQNGIYFGAGSQINVGSLTATTLDNIANNTIENIYSQGILSNQTAPVFSFADAVGVIDVAGAELDADGKVVKEAANIKAATGGRVMLLAPDVKNSGVIRAQDGQVILAAGKTIYLSTLDKFAGLLVEVSSGGTATNLGDIFVNNGNASMIGLAVNQQGRISASTSVRANGSIYLKAKEIQSLTRPGDDVYGNVTLGKNSLTGVTIDMDDKEEVIDAKQITPSLVDIKGKDIDILGTVIANSGQVNVTGIDIQNNNSSIYLGDEALIDVSGVDANAPMSRHQLAIKLFSDQLRDSPVLRGGPLFGETVFIDARKGTKILSKAVLDEAMAGITRTVAERSTDGGQVNLNAVNVVSKQGSTIDISAGSTTYQEGSIRETSLEINGKYVLISEAEAGVPVQGASDYYNIFYERWNQSRNYALTAKALNGLTGSDTFVATDQSVSGYFNASYQQGGNAGALNVSTSNMALQGSVLANTTNGIYQRGEIDKHTSTLGGLFNLVYSNAGGLNFVSGVTPLDADFNEQSQLTDTQKQTTEINAAALLSGGINRMRISAGGAVNMNQALQFQPNGELNVAGSGGVNVQQNITLPSGQLTLSGSQTADVIVADGVQLNVSGMLTNDRPGVPGAMTGLVAVDGGTITLNNGVRLGQGATLAANAGFWIDNQSKVTMGHGGDITVTLADSAVNASSFQAYGLFNKGVRSTGGHLSLQLQDDGGTSALNHIHLGGVNPDQDDILWLSEGFFTQGGFASYAISNAGRVDGDVLIGDTADHAVTLQPEQHSMGIVSAALSATTGSDPASLTRILNVADGLRSPASLTVHAGDDLTLASQAAIVTDTPVTQAGARGNVTLSSKGQMTILGDITTPSGNIQLSIANIPIQGDLIQPNSSFDPTLSLYLGEQASLSARAQYVTPPTPDGNLRSAFVADAGNISLTAGNGVLIAKQGSVIDVSGVSGRVALPVRNGFAEQFAAGDAGSISLAARDGMALDGALTGRPSGAGAGGSLVITLGGEPAVGEENNANAPLFFANGDRLLTVTQSKQLLAGNNQAGGDASNLIDTSVSLTAAKGIGQISAAQINEGGFDNLTLKVDNVSAHTGDAIQFADNVSLSVPSQITLDATSVSGAANINSATLILANTSGVVAGVSDLIAGSGELRANAQFIDIQGNVAIDRVAGTSLNSRSDIRSRGVNNSLGGETSLTAPGYIQLDAAQIYPATATEFTITATGPDSRIEVSNHHNAASQVPMSAVGSMTLNADTILQAGTLRAPLGQITLNAAKELVLASNSLTSVSAEGSLIPYAVTVLGGTQLANNVGAVNNFFTKIDNKKVTLNADDLNLQAGSRVDISGGGDTFAYEWIQGIGGSIDILGQSGYYAVLPSLGNQYAPYDFLMSRGSDVALGQAVYLSGGNGLAAGTYTLLPARYALVPGAFLVKTNGQSMQLNTQLAQLDGSALSSGYFTKLDGTSRDQYTSFNILNGDTFYTNYGTKDYKGLADYRITTGNTFIQSRALQDGRDIPRLARDAGQLVLAADNSLNLEGTIVSSKAEGAKGALVDISSSDIRVVSAIDSAVTGVLQISADQLSAISADSILLGGSRTVSGSVQNVNTAANNVTFSNDATHAVTLDSLIIASKDTITLNQGAVVKTREQQGEAGKTTVVTSGDGALLALSAKNDIDFSRTGVTPGATQGQLIIEDGATVSAGRSLVLDATNRFDQSGEIHVADGGSVTLGANQFAVGDQPVMGATQIDNNTLSDFGHLSAMTFNSYQNIVFTGESSFGNNALAITFNTAGLSHQGNGDVSITADSFTLKNTLASTFTPALTSNGALTVNANRIGFGQTGAASANIDGFNQVNLLAAKDVTFSGTGTLNINAAQTTINSAVMTADSGANYSMTNSGLLQTQHNGQQAGVSNGLGASLRLSAAEMDLGGKLVMHSGDLRATATSGNLTLASGGLLDVSAATVAFDANNQATTDAGNIQLTSNLGNVEVQSNALIDVSGEARAGDAGMLAVEARNGQFIIADNTLDGTSAQGEKAASFTLDVGRLDNFSDVNQALESGHFTQSRDLRVRGGDVTIAASDTVTAQKFTLGVDNGSANIAGRINADGQKGGDVAVYAKDLVTLGNTAIITARGQQANQSAGDLQTGSGGTVLLSSNSLSTVNAVSAASGAVIDTSGYDASDNNNVGVDGYDGSVTLRGQRGTTGTSNTVNVAFDTTAAIKGASEVRVEGVRTYTATTFNNTIAGLVNDTNNFYNANTTSGSYAITQDGLAAKVLPHIEVRSTNGDTLTNMSTTADINLRSFGAMLAGRGGALTLRANGNLTMNGSLSDGFSTALANGVLQANTDTFSYNLIAGADYSAANLTETVAGIGSFTLANGKLIRTGEGDITIAAGGNMTLGNASSVIYTIGKAVDTLAGFSAGTSGTNVPNAASYVNYGGDINVTVQGNITGAATTQTVNQWLLRQGGNNVDTSWWVRPDLFQQGIGALGGGNVQIQAGGNVTNVSAVSATNAQYDNSGDSPTGASIVNGGGDVSVGAGGNLVNGVYYAGRGNVQLQAGDSVVKTGNTGTVIALQDASAEVKAKNDIKIETVFNPTLWVQGNTLGIAQLGSSTFFNTYGAQSAVTTTALAGDIELGLRASNALSSTGLSTGYSIASVNDMGAIHPGTVSATAFAGDITAYKMVLAPSATGNLTLLAAGSVIGGNTSTGNINPIAQILISDADLSSVLNVNAPTTGQPTTISAIIGSIKTGISGIPVHQNDPTVATIVAREGDVSLQGTPTATSTNIYGLKSYKPVYISAGNNVTVHASIQHNQADDISIISAGNDFVMENGEQLARVDMNGPGELLIKAGRNIDLGNTSGILSLANTVNPNLASNSANVTLLAGLGKQGADITSFVSTYIDANGAGPESLRGDAVAMAAYRKATAERVQQFIKALTGNDVSETAAMQQFLALDSAHQEVFAYQQFQSELFEAGKEYIDTASTTRGDQAIASLFPHQDYSGDILMYQSQIRTSRDGNITMFAPGGLINAGVASNGNLQHDIGIVTEKGGNINVYAEGDFMVNQSKVITQFGGDIIAWSNQGDLNAGRGSKSAVSVPERVVSINAFGDVTVEVKGVASGSGIRAQTYDPDGPAAADGSKGLLPAPAEGTVGLFAPRGVLDAGEAGIQAGNFFGGALQVLNSTNITISGSSSGVPAADTGSLAGAALGATNTSAGANTALTETIGNSVNNQNTTPKELPPIVTVKTIRLED